MQSGRDMELLAGASAELKIAANGFVEGRQPADFDCRSRCCMFQLSLSDLALPQALSCWNKRKCAAIGGVRFVRR
jgi:hypothetical protein